MTIEQKRNIFEIRNRMATIPANFPYKQKNKKHFCPCEQNEDMKHIYNCKYWNNEETTTEYDKIFGDDIDQQIKVNKRFQHNLEKREEFNFQGCTRVTNCLGHGIFGLFMQNLGSECANLE